jgi:hypothetical protein
MTRHKLETPQDYLRIYPRLCAHVICESLGYAPPSRAARIVMDAHLRQKNYCEWVWSCYNQDPLPPVRNAFKGRHSHHGFMAEYKLAKALVDEANRSGNEPIFASWF